MRHHAPRCAAAYQPAIILSSVVLPHPDGPGSVKNSPASMLMVTLSTAVSVPKRRVTLRISSSAMAGTGRYWKWLPPILATFGSADTSGGRACGDLCNARRERHMSTVAAEHQGRPVQTRTASTAVSSSAIAASRVVCCFCSLASCCNCCCSCWLPALAFR